MIVGLNTLNFTYLIKRNIGNAHLSVHPKGNKKMLTEMQLKFVASTNLHSNYRLDGVRTTFYLPAPCPISVHLL